MKKSLDLFHFCSLPSDSTAGEQSARPDGDSDGPVTLIFMNWKVLLKATVNVSISIFRIFRALTVITEVSNETQHVAKKDMDCIQRADSGSDWVKRKPFCSFLWNEACHWNFPIFLLKNKVELRKNRQPSAFGCNDVFTVFTSSSGGPACRKRFQQRGTSHDEERGGPDVKIKVLKLRSGEQQGPNTGKM